MSGEPITYKITVTNDGNLTITDITVTDELTGDGWTIDSLAPNAFETYEATYTVSKDDAEAGKVLNEATGKGTSPDPDEPDVPVDPGTSEDEVGCKLIVHYVYEDDTTAADDFTKTYKNGDTYDVASPTITGYTASEARVSGTITKDTELWVRYTRTPYTLTIRYRYANGTTAARTVTRTLYYGDLYNVLSPTIAGYTANRLRVRGNMPARNVTVTVIYTGNGGGTPEEELILIDDYATALGLGGLTLNSGDCIE